MENKRISIVLTPALKALAETTPSTTTLTPPNESWNSKWLKLRTEHHPKLKELEREAGLFCFGMWQAPMRGRMLLLFGENGTAKTHTANAVHRWVSSVGHGKTWFPTMGVRAQLQSLFWHWPALLDELKGGNWDLVEDCMNVPCLIIDELGGGHDPSGVGVDKLCQILSRREKMWTLITTNITADAWETKFDRRVASRFFRNSTHVDLSDVPDYSTMQ